MQQIKKILIGQGKTNDHALSLLNVEFLWTGLMKRYFPVSSKNTSYFGAGLGSSARGLHLNK